MSDLREKRVELILQQLEDLPTLPSVAVRVLEVTASEASDAKEVVSLIQSDPSLTARILQLVHRSDVGVRGEVSSVERAVILLGFEAVRSAVLAISVFETFREADKPLPSQFRRDEFWKHCVAVACCCGADRTVTAATDRSIPPKHSSAACCTTWAKSRSKRRCRRAFTGWSRRRNCCAATSPTSSEPSSAWITWSSASDWPSDGSCPRTCATASGCTVRPPPRSRRACGTRGW